MKTTLSSILSALNTAIGRTRASEDGWVTPLVVVLLVAFLGLAGFAVDVAHVMSKRTHLQATADSAAHGAILFRQVESEAQAVSRSLDIAAANMPRGTHGNVVRAENIVFGIWNPDTRTFTPRLNSRDAVMVTAERIHENGNPVPVFLLQFAGLDAWSVSAVSIFSARNHPCFFNGILADRVAAFQSNNTFQPDFCIHANDYVSLRQNNTFLPGSIVSMPDISRIDLPASGMDGNPGLEDALLSGSIDLEIVRTLSDVINGLRSGDPAALPGYTTNHTPREVRGRDVTDETFQSGSVYNVQCSGNNATLTLTSGMDLTGVVITTNCNVQMGNGAAIRDSIIATTSTSRTSVSGTAESGAQATVGRACAPGPGTQVLTLGGMRFPAMLNVNGGQFVAARTIEFAAQATVEGSGVSIVSGENVDWTSNANMSVQYCDEEFDNHLAEKRIRMVN